jgi:protein TonB
MNKKLFFKTGIFVAFFVIFTAFGASAQGVKITKIGDEQSIGKDTTVYDVVEVFPEFSGGEKALLKFLSDNIVYPKEARGKGKKGIEGCVMIEFIVEKDGSLSNFTIKRSIHPLLDDEALRVVKLMPNWMPGKQNGKPVRVHFTQPIVFQLN